MDPLVATTDDRIAEVWQVEHRHLLDIAFRMLGDIREAEDAVQEAFIRLVRNGIDGIDDPRGWLTVVVGRICIDMMRSARVRPPTANGAAPPVEALAGAPDPADRITLDDAVRAALLVVLERLTPPERTAFVLHDVFQLDFDTVGSIVGRSAAASRQLASRARRHIATADRGWEPVEPADHRRVTEGFIAACAGGDLQGLLALLDPDVDGDGSPGGFLPAFRPIRGAHRIAPNLLRRFGPGSGFTLVSMRLRDQPAVVASTQQRVAVVLLLDLVDGRIHHIHAVGDPSAL
jgi:RNA polymerase sigma-70 factor (ECF subfamily)